MPSVVGMASNLLRPTSASVAFWSHIQSSDSLGALIQFMLSITDMLMGVSPRHPLSQSTSLETGLQIAQANRSSPGTDDSAQRVTHGLMGAGWDRRDWNFELW
jgi:hypothetical protein